MHFLTSSSLNTERRFRTMFRQAHSQAGHKRLTSSPVLCLSQGHQKVIAIRSPFMLQASGFRVIYTASKMAIGHHSCLLIRNELSAEERRQWHYWNGNPIRALTGNIRKEMNSIPQKQSPREIRKLPFLKICAIYFLRWEPKGSNYICILFKPEFFSWNSL